MIIKFLKELKASVTEEEFNEILIIAEQDIKFNQIGFNKLTKAKTFIEICINSLILIRREQDYGKSSY